MILHQKNIKDDIRKTIKKKDNIRKDYIINTLNVFNNFLKKFKFHLTLKMG